MAVWSEARVAEAARHPSNLRMYADAPYVRTLLGPLDSVSDLVVHPRDVKTLEVAPPLRLSPKRGGYYIPGSARDLLLHTSCALAVSPAVGQYVGESCDAYDFGPPLWNELLEGSFGSDTSMKPAWKRLAAAVDAHMMRFGFLVVADISDCIGSMRADRCSTLLGEAGADSEAIRVIELMHRQWQAHGCRGMPLTPGFRIMIKLYLKAADEHLRAEGVPFVRLQDDFRLFCDTEVDAERSLAVLREALEQCGFTLNAPKTFILPKGQVRWSPRRHWLAVRSKLSAGVVRPLLADLLHTPVLGDAAGHVLPRMLPRRWQPVAQTDTHAA